MTKKKKTEALPELEELLDKDGSEIGFLVLHNDDIHTFDYVIESLMEVCEHDVVQAEQCTFIVHFKGKCDVKKGTPHLLTPMCSELLRRGLTATIN